MEMSNVELQQQIVTKSIKMKMHSTRLLAESAFYFATKMYVTHA
jgi:hypothetical protein